MKPQIVQRCFSEPIPRKGTETRAIQHREQTKMPGFSEPIPRKGTETSDRARESPQSLYLFFRTYSPQGDGNIAGSFQK